MRLVLAFGNPLRGDDAVAWEVARGISGSGEVDVLCLHQLTPELAERLAASDGVVFVDAAATGDPGAVSVLEISAEAQAPPTPFGHTLTPGALLEIAARLYGCAPPAWLVTVTGRDYGFGTELSPPVREALPRARAAARSCLERLAERKACAHARRVS
jgi:hydrogenase maturation protease